MNVVSSLKLIKTRSVPCILPLHRLSHLRYSTCSHCSQNRKQVRFRPLMVHAQDNKGASATENPSVGVGNNDRGGAFVDHCDIHLSGAPTGALAGLTFAVKDLFDVKGFRTGHGNPTWLKTYPPADAHASVVQRLLSSGASAIGKTHMDEIAYSLNGENFHYGTPVNPAAPERVPGGSSSGSASAVAQGLCDIGLGSDTGGSIRVPASYCGLCGFRPTHGRVSMEGSRPLAPSFDTCGWFTRDMALLERVGRVLLDSNTAGAAPVQKWLVATDAFALADKSTVSAIYAGMSDGAAFAELCQAVGKPIEVKVAPEGDPAIGDLNEWLTAFRVLQAWEVWECHGEWVQKAKPNFGPGINDRFQMASEITAEQRAAAADVRRQISTQMDALLAPAGTVLLVPSTPGPGPMLDTPQDELNDFRMRALTLTSIAGLAGLPQLNFPLASEDGAPIGLGVIGARGMDEELLKFGLVLEKILPMYPSRNSKA